MKLASLMAGVSLAVLAACPALAAEASGGEEGFTIKPVVLDSDDSSGATVGLEYALKRSFELRRFATSDGGGLDPSPSRGAITLAVDGQGTVTADAARNPKNFLDLAVSLNVDYDPGYEAGFGRLLAGAFVKGEADQSFDDHQAVYGAQVGYGRRGLFGRNDFFALDVRYGEVKPGEDKTRKAALGVTSLDNYSRVDAEALYMWRTGWSRVPVVEFNYRIYQEVDPAAAIKAAGLDRHELATVRASLGGDFFVAYSSGKLPFDRKDDQIFEIGLSYKLF